jgi:hypothetical protein
MERAGALAGLLLPDRLTFGGAFALWLALEVIFYVLVYRVIHPRVEPLRKAPPNPHPPAECLGRLLDCLRRLEGVYSPEEFWSGWFKGADASSIGRDNVKVSRRGRRSVDMCVCARPPRERAAPRDAPMRGPVGVIGDTSGDRQRGGRSYIPHNSRDIIAVRALRLRRAAPLASLPPDTRTWRHPPCPL